MIMAIGALLLINFFSFFTIKTFQAGKFVYNKKKFPNYNGRVFLIAGEMSQPEKAYGRIEMPYSVRVNMRYSLLGFNPIEAGKQLEELALSEDYIVASSLGCKALVYSHRDDIKRVMIDPATHSIILKAERQMRLRLAPILVVLAYALGWLSVIPFIPTRSGNFYSFALLSDQLYWLYYGDPRFNDIGKLDKLGMIISTEDDEKLVWYIAESIYNGVALKEIKAKHCDTIKNYSVYDAALKNLLVKY